MFFFINIVKKIYLLKMLVQGGKFFPPPPAPDDIPVPPPIPLDGYLLGAFFLGVLIVFVLFRKKYIIK
jgi:hypothetical protein